MAFTSIEEKSPLEETLNTKIKERHTLMWVLKNKEIHCNLVSFLQSTPEARRLALVDSRS